MFRIARRLLVALILGAGLLPLIATPVSAATPVLFDSIAPGVQRGVEGFGPATVLVPNAGYVTYLIRTDSRLHGRRVQIWTDTGRGWKLTTTRAIGLDGSIHYFARVTGRIGFWAKYASGTTSAASHGRLANVSADGSTTIRISCEDVGPIGAGVRSIVSRSVATSLNGTVRVIVCSNASTGYAWGMVALDDAHLSRVGHTVRSGTGGGAAGTETWSVRATSAGVGRTTLVYSQPWRGGDKAAWTLMLTVVTS